MFWDVDKETGFETKHQPQNRLFDRGEGSVSKTIQLVEKHNFPAMR
jgi:hypothetical protein